ncbi:hypothetical protein [Kiloniella laminariae]|uniref:hypothetical protein n=1 Tax=Kiloniella laminariae TaxID=454162 RepID=UPI000373192A|nr:hypothetical protein [Kiloniella laminariae]
MNFLLLISQEIATKALIENKLNYHFVSGEQFSFSALSTYCHPHHFLVLDLCDHITMQNPAPLHSLVKTLNKNNIKTILIDGLGQEIYHRPPEEMPEILISPYVMSEGSKTARNCEHWLNGGQYAVLPPEVLLHKYKGEKSGKLLITMGGSDPDYFTEALLEYLLVTNAQDFSFIEKIEIIVTRLFSKDRINPIKNVASQISLETTVLVNPPNFLEVLAYSRLVLCGYGLTRYETAAIGVPTIALIKDEIAENTKPFEDEGIMPLVNTSKNGWKTCLSEIVKMQLSSLHPLQPQQTIDGKGANRIILHLEKFA